MTDNGEQLAFFDITEPQKAKGKTKADFTDYEGFVEKFKTKKTTDDCYTPQIVYDAIADWVAAEYGVNRANFVRPFYPGWNYQDLDYTGKTVVDNPPFSILGQIVSYYDLVGVKFFLFAPQLTSMAHACKNCCYIYTDCAITYENGVVIGTAFLTNLEPHEILIKTNPELTEIVNAANDRARKQNKPPELPKYKYPPEVISVQLVSALARHGIPITIKRNECYFIRKLDSQKRQGKALFGSGFLTTRAKGAELNEARRQADEARRQADEARWQADDARRQVWELSPRELQIIKELEERQRDI